MESDDPSFRFSSNSDEALGLIESGLLDTEDLHSCLANCTWAEQTVYTQFVRAAMACPEADFLVQGYLVANRRLLGAQKHGRFKAHVASLIRKNMILPLNPAFSRCQYYLVGCRFEGHDYFASWIKASVAWQTFLTPPTNPYPDSKRARRPEHAETPDTLKLKGLLPNKPIALSLNSNPQKYGEPARSTRARTNRKAFSRQPKSAKPSRYEERLVLASEIARLTQTPRISSGKDGQLLDHLNRLYGCDVALKIVSEAWLARDSLLSDSYPTFTAQTVWYFARFRRTSHRANQQTQSGTVNFQQLIFDCINDEGKINHEQLLKRLELYGVQRSTAVDAICREFELDADRLFPI